MNKGWIVAGVLAVLGVLPGTVSAQTPDTGAGKAVFENRCKSCHEPAVGRAPGRADLANRPAADIVTALTSGIMKPMAAGLSQADISAVAAYLTAAPAETAGGGIEKRPVRAPMGPVGKDPMCMVNEPIKSGPSDWATMGVDTDSTRFQRHPGLTAADLPRLKVKWSFAMAGGGQPIVVGDWLFTTNRSGAFYALDTKTGCVHWTVSGVVSRTTPAVLRSTRSPSGWITYVSVADRSVRAYDAQTGKELWRSPVLETHPSSVMTGSPVAWGDQLFVPLSSIEEASSMSKDYACCTFRGSLVALNAKTGAKQWQTFVIPEIAHPIDRKNASGKQLLGPAGAAIWSAPTVDPNRGLVYVVTGDSYTDVETKGDDAVFAMEMKSGKIRWQHQVTEKDNFVMGCGPTSKTGNCPSPTGPDYDFGATPILMKTTGGKSVLMAGQKSGIVYGFNPDNGRLIWKTQVGVGSALGGVEWGIGADAKQLYVPIADLGGLFAEARNAPDLMPGVTGAKPGISALDPATGKIRWFTPAPRAACHYAIDKDKPSTCIRAQSAAPGVIPGLVFSGTLDGWFRAYDAATGKIAWEYSTTAQTYDTVNGIKGQPGGAIDGMGPTIAGGMVFVMSGFNGASRVGSNGVNVLLAFSKDGK
jgi:polyvinyl alcohol dehydrogenase (cytochrome)